MAIDEGSLIEPLRPTVAFVGVDVPPEVQAAIRARGYSAEHCRPAQLEDSGYLSTLRAVVFIQDERAPVAVRKDLLRHAPRALDFGCNVVVRPAAGCFVGLLGMMSSTLLKDVISTPQKERPAPSIRIDDENTPWERIAEFVDRKGTGRPPERRLQPEIEPKRDGTPIQLTPPQEILVQRAFWDCERLYLRPLEDGRSGATVLLAFPTLKQPYYLSRWPTPCCLKIPSREEAFAEYKAHRERVDPYIPFHLGPQMIPERCFLGASEGIVVTDFVEESEVLVDCARAGRASAAIAGLFNRTLHGWYRDAKEIRTSLDGYLPEPDPIPGERMERARELGAKTSQEVLQKLLRGMKPKQLLVGPIHGDLNAGNILIRGGDAVVIDFSKHRPAGALLFDAASLEASLLVRGFAKDDRDEKAWLASVIPAYERDALLSMPPYIDPDSHSCWFFECVRQIRRYARQMERGEKQQYGVMVGAALLKLAAKDLRLSTREEGSRAAAYVLAEKALTGMLRVKNGTPPRNRRLARVT